MRFPLGNSKTCIDQRPGQRFRIAPAALDEGSPPSLAATKGMHSCTERRVDGTSSRGRFRRCSGGPPYFIRCGRHLVLTRRKPDPHSPPLWLAVTRLTKNKLGPLFDWTDGLFSHDRQLHLFGPMMEKIPLPPWVNYHGPAEPAKLQNEWFPRACGLITLSQHAEGRPQVVLEAMAARLPVIASDIPAHRDLIRDRETGWLARTPQDIRDGVAFLSKTENNDPMGNAARTWVAEHIGTWDDCARRYVDAYRALMRRTQ